MMTKIKKKNIFLFIFILPYQGFAQDDVKGTTVTDGFNYPSITQNIPAFPSAEGFGKFTTGGRGGRVVTVTNLEDDINNPPEGSLRWAINQYPGEPITVVFDVSGWIYLKDILRIRHKGGITIAGQTAPGEGITLYPRGISFNSASDENANAIVRNIRVRCGSRAWNGEMLDVENPEQTLGTENAYNLIIDHCTFGWSGEELCTNSNSFFQTYQYNIFHEGLYNAGHKKGQRGYGVCWGGGASTFTHNLLAHNLRRSPRFSASVNYDYLTYFEFVNNVNYNWGGTHLGSYGGDNKGTSPRYSGYLANIVNNYWRTGPATIKSVTADKQIFTSLGGGTKSSYFYINGNIMDRRKDFNANNSICVDTDDKVHIVNEKLTPKKFYTREWSFDINAYTTLNNPETAEEAYESVLDKSGCIVRDAIEERIIKECRDATATYGGSWNNGKYGIIDDPTDAEMSLNTDGTTICSTAKPMEKRPAGWDFDGDGMPDTWEIANGFDPTNASDGNYINPEGYTALEKYLNSIMGEKISGPFGPISSVRTEHAVNFIVNQNRGNIIITGDENLNMVHIFDELGRCRLTTQLHSGDNSIYTGNLPSRTYIIWVTSKNHYRNAVKMRL